MRYRTIVADPPWPMGSFGHFVPGQAGPRPQGATSLGSSPLPYDEMPVEEIETLPVEGMAEEDAHLYLWTTNRYVEAAYDVVRAWGFKPSTLLTWCKAPMGLGLGGAFVVTTEFVLYARRGSLVPLRREDTSWFRFKRPYGKQGGIHSAKPDGFLDLVEQVSPGPYLELFARRARFGWDYFGDESLGTAEMPKEAA